MELEQQRAQIAKLGLGLAAISYDSPAILHDFAQRHHIDFPLLSDAGSKVIRAAGILNTTVPKTEFAYGIPYPGTFILDANGVVTGKYFEDDFRDRYTAANVIARQFGAVPRAAEHEVTGKQITATLWASNAAVAMNQRITLAIDVHLPPGLHVYSPGVQGYIPIDWKLEVSPAYHAAPVSYPKSEILYLKAIQEKVPVYKGDFRLERDVTMSDYRALKAAAGANGELTIHGTLRYQACDDRICYIPRELPLDWTLRVEAPDLQRAPASVQHK